MFVDDLLRDEEPQTRAPARLGTEEFGEQFGLHPDWVEAVAFAWFAQQTRLAVPPSCPRLAAGNRAATKQASGP